METYESKKQHKLTQFNDTMLSSQCFKSCPLCEESLHPSIMPNHLKECSWWWFEIFAQGNTPFLPPPKTTNAVINTNNSSSSKRRKVEETEEEEEIYDDSDDETSTQAPEYPLDREKYHMAALARKADAKRKKQPHTCIVDPVVCTKFSNSPSGIFVFIGTNKLHICKHQHLNSDSIKNKIIVKLSAAAETFNIERDLSDTEICSLSKCKKQCGTFFQVGARDTDVRKRANFCSFVCLWGWLKSLKAREWNTFVRDHKKEKNADAEDEIQQAIASQNVQQ